MEEDWMNFKDNYGMYYRSDWIENQGREIKVAQNPIHKLCYLIIDIS